MATALLWVHRLADPLATTTGIGRYALELTDALADDGTWEVALGARTERGNVDTRFGRVPVHRLRGPRAAVALSWAVLHWPPVERCGVRADVVHVLNVGHPVPARAPMVHTVHDLFVLLHPEWYGARDVAPHARALRDACGRGGPLIAVSQYVADGVIDRLGVAPERVTVVHHGVRSQPEPPADAIAAARRRAGVDAAPYFLALGEIGPRKNFDVVVRALGAASSDLADAHFVIAGPPGRAGHAVQRAAVDARCTDRVHMTGFVDDDERAALVAGATALVHPSLDEGFGMPPLEAMSLGTPTVVSTAGALPEVTGDAALLVDPANLDAWAEAMRVVLCDSTARDTLVERGRARAAHFRWSDAARATQAVWARALEEHAR